MRLKIKVKLFEGAVLPTIIEKGDWVDLRCNKTVDIQSPQAEVQKKKVKDGQVVERYRNVRFNNVMIPLGVTMQLPEGFEAHVLPRSGTYKNYGIILANHQGIIDHSYCGNDDEWKFNAIALRNTHIEGPHLIKVLSSEGVEEYLPQPGDRICQFRIELSQKATVWQKLKWLFASGIEFVQVNTLEDNNRGGFNSTGVR